MKKNYVLSILISLNFAKTPNEKISVNFYGNLTNDKIDESFFNRLLIRYFGSTRLLDVANQNLILRNYFQL